MNRMNYKLSWSLMTVVLAVALVLSVFTVMPTKAVGSEENICIEFNKSGPLETVEPGQEIYYSFSATNNCDFALKSGIQCYDLLLGGLIWNNELEIGETKSFSKSYIVTAEDCREFQFTNEAWCEDGTKSATSHTASWTVFCRNCQPSGTGTPGYWKNHPEAWPVDSITIGGVEYSKENAIQLMSQAIRGDKTITLFKALVAAKLNIADCNDGNCVKLTIAMADDWMESYGPVGKGVKANSSEWQQGESLYETLDDYNNGKLCAPARD